MKMKPIEIDGSFGEGGGQILRTALSLSCITGRSLKLTNIRRGRKKPGLMPQHLMCVNAAALISHARVSGNKQGSTELSFSPEKIKYGNYLFDIGTAGSCSLVLQTLLPPLLFAEKPSHITVRGGTHVPFSPPYHYLSEVFVPMLNRVDIKAETSINTYGFYPKGGGEVRFKVVPIKKKTMETSLVSRGKLLSVRGFSGVSHLPVKIAERQKSAMVKSISPIPSDIKIMEVPSTGHGTFVFLTAEYENSLAGFSSLGKKGKPAEQVGREAAALFAGFHGTSACLDPNLADQIVIYLGITGKDSSFTTSRITQHLLTNLWVIRKFLNIDYVIEGETNSEGGIKLVCN